MNGPLNCNDRETKGSSQGTRSQLLALIEHLANGTSLQGLFLVARGFVPSSRPSKE